MGLGNLNVLSLFTDPDFKRRGEENHAVGFRQNWLATSPFDGARLPGAAVFDASGTLLWIHRGRHPGDLPPISEMLEIASGLVAT